MDHERRVSQLLDQVASSQNHNTYDLGKFVSWFLIISILMRETLSTWSSRIAGHFRATVQVRSVEAFTSYIRSLSGSLLENANTESTSVLWIETHDQNAIKSAF